jgi:hypothetical protein
MRLKTLIVALVAALAATSVALAHDRPAKPAKPAKACKGKAQVAVMLAGTLTSDPAADSTSFTMKVLRSNRHGRLYKKAGEATLNVDAKTRYRKAGKDIKLEDLALNDQVHVQAKVAKCALRGAAADALPALTGRKVHVKSAPAPEAPEAPESPESGA